MKHFLLLYSFFLLCTTLSAQSPKEKITGDWKYYLEDKTTFELLRLNEDGTGVKAFGKTINEKDTLFLDHITYLDITNWQADGKSLKLNSNNKVGFKINPLYKLQFTGNDQIALTGEHLQLHLNLSYLNRKEFSRTVIYERADKFKAAYGVKSAACIVGQKIFSFTPINSVIHRATCFLT